MIDEKKTGARRVKARRAPHYEIDACELHRHAAKHALRAVVLARIDEDPDQNEKAAHGKEKRRGEQPMVRAPRDGPGAAKSLLARGALVAAGAEIGCSLSPFIPSHPARQAALRSDSASRVKTSPSTTTSTGFFRSNSIRAAVRLEAIGCRICEPVKQSRQILHQAQTADRPPVHIFDRAAVDCCLRRNHHLTAGVLAIAKGYKQTAPIVSLAVGAKRKRAAAQPCQGNQHSGQVAGLAQEF